MIQLKVRVFKLKQEPRLKICCNFYFDNHGYISLHEISETADVSADVLIEMAVKRISEITGVQMPEKRIPLQIFYTESYFRLNYPRSKYLSDPFDCGYNLSFLNYIASPKTESLKEDNFIEILKLMRDDRIRESEDSCIV